MADAEYEIWLLNSDNSRWRVLTDWSHLVYHLTLNRLGALEELAIPANNWCIPFLALERRILVLADGAPEWGGRVQGEGWSLPATSPAGTSYAVRGLDHAHYAQRRILKADAGTAFDEANDHADDVAKYYVKRNLGSLAAPERQFADLAVEADRHECPVVRKRWRGEQMIDRLAALATEKQFYWRFVPTNDGCEFRTRYPLWGADRSRGNGMNRECIFDIGRKTASAMEYEGDVAGHFNFFYVAGGGQEELRKIEEYSDTDAIAAYDRRELWVDARNSDDADLDDVGDEAKETHKASLVLSCTPAPGTYKKLWGLGDKASVRCYQYGREFEQEAVITSVKIGVGADGVVHPTPTMEIVL